jgi:biopolymer transport protein TolR
MIRSRFKRRGRGRGAGKGGSGHGMPALIPMIDMLTILVVYLLVHAADYEILPNTKNISIPMSTAEKAPRETITMLVTREDLFVNGAKVMTVAALDAETAPTALVLVQALRSEAAKSLLGKQNTTPPEITVMADKELPYRVLRKIMNAGTAAEFGKLSLAVVEKETAARGPAS